MKISSSRWPERIVHRLARGGESLELVAVEVGARLVQRLRHIPQPASRLADSVQRFDRAVAALGGLAHPAGLLASDPPQPLGIRRRLGGEGRIVSEGLHCGHSPCSTGSVVQLAQTRVGPHIRLVLGIHQSIAKLCIVDAEVIHRGERDIGSHFDVSHHAQLGAPLLELDTEVSSRGLIEIRAEPGQHAPEPPHLGPVLVDAIGRIVDGGLLALDEPLCRLAQD